MKIILSNSQIYDILSNLNFDDSIIFPIKVNYAIQINKKTLMEKGEIIEKLRYQVGKKYGTFNDSEQSFFIPDENREKAQKELDDLLEIEQSVNIMMISLNDLEDVKLTSSQMAGLLFMIETDD